MDGSMLPRGVPTLSYVRVLDPEGGLSTDIVLDGDFVSVMEPGHPTTRHEVAHAFERGITDQQFCEATIGQDAGASMNASLNPIAAFVEDATTAVVFFVGSKLSKKWQFLKRVFLPFASNEMFECIRDKDHQGAQVYEYEITFSAFEIQDEIITDLLRPSSRGLTIAVSPEDGITVQGIHKEKVTDELSLRQSLIDACDNRACHTLPPGGSIDTSTAVWEINLIQKEGDEDIVLYNSSKLIFVDLPALDALCPGSVEAKVFEGPNLHRSLFAFADCAKKMSIPTQATLAPFRSSKLTHYFSEMLGGNAVVLALGILHPGEAPVTRKVLEVMSNLTNARHFPISGKETNELIQGLTMKYRSMILNMEDEVNKRTKEESQAIKASTSDGDTAESDMAKKYKADLDNTLLEAQKQLAEIKIDRDLARKDAVQMFEMMELLKAKYATLIEENKKQNEELIRSETEKLEVARALIDMKLELGSVMEVAEKDRFELSTQVLALKNQLLESEEREEMSQIALADAKDKLDDCQTLYEQEKEKGAVTRAQLSDMKTQFDIIETRNLEIGSELVTLLNTRDTLERELEVSRKQLKDMENSLNADRTDISALRSGNMDFEAKVADLERENEDLQRQLTEERIEMHRMSIEIERSKLEFERSTNEYLKGKDVVSKREAQAYHNEIQRLQYEKEQLLVSLRREERKRRDDMRMCNRMEQDYKAAQDSLKDAVMENDKLRESYRNYLSGLLYVEGKSAQPPITGRSSRPQSSASQNQRRELQPHSDGSNPDGSAAIKADQCLEDLVKSYTENERKLFAQMDSSNKGQSRAVFSWRQLFDYYRNAIDIIEDNCPQALPAHIINDENEAIPPLNTARERNARQEGSDRDSLDRRVKHAEDALLREQEVSSITIAKFKKKLQAAESVAARKTEENNFLKEQLEKISAGVSKGESEGGTLQALYGRLEEQMLNMKKNGNVVDLRRQLTGLKAQYNILEEENQEMRALLLQANSHGQRGRAAPSPYVPRDSDDAALIHQLKEIEGRNASLTSRNAGLQEEMRAYKIYMRDTVSQYKRQIKALQSQIASYNVVSKRDKQAEVKFDDNRDSIFVPNLKSDINDRSGRLSVGDTNIKSGNRPYSGQSRLGLPDISNF